MVRSRSVARWKGLFAGTLVLIPLWTIGQLARDSLWITGLCFYIPSALLAALLLGWTMFHWAGQRRWAATLSVGLGLAPLCVALFLENQLPVQGLLAHPDQVRLVHWNVGYNLGSGAQAALAAHRADIYILSEAPHGDVIEAFRKSLGGEYQSAEFGGLAVVAAGRLRTNGWLLDRPRTKAQTITWERAGRSVVLLIVDLPSELRVHRDRVLRQINELIERHSPDLVVGDFNAPRRSWGLSNLPTGYRHAYETAGGGCGYTWPVPAPMYALDHCLHATTVLPMRYELHSSIYSDHRRQVFDFAKAK